MLSSVRPLMRQNDSRRPVWEFADRVQITKASRVAGERKTPPDGNQLVSAMTSGVVPDLFQNTPAPGTGLHPKASDLGAPHCSDPMRPEKDPSRHFLVLA